MDDTELYAELEIEGENEQVLDLDDYDTQRYLDLELENEISVIDSGSANIGEGTLTITQGGVTKGTFNANSKVDVTIEVDAGGEGDYAPINSPAFTGTPTAPTPTAGTDTTQIATCEFVTDAINTAIVEVENGSY